MENISWGFDALPKEMKQLIFSFTDLDATTVLRIQAVSSSFKKLCWAWVRDLNASVPDVINRVNGELIRSVDCSKWKDPVNSVIALLKVLPNLERIYFSLNEEDSSLTIVANKISELDQHPKLRQISYQDGFWIRSTISNSNDSQRFNRYREAVTQMDPVVLDKVYHRGGILSDKVTEKDSKMIVIGATDGTLQFLTLDHEEDEREWSENALNVVLTKNDIHKDCINAIWSEAFIFYQSPTYVASSDGIVSSWSCTNDVPVLHKIFEFPESILFVCEYAEKYVLAAGKRTLYIAEIEPNKITQEIAVEDDITGLFCLNKIVALSTKDSVYSLKQASDDGGDFVLQKEFAITECQNMWLSPDALLRAVIHSTYFDLRTNATNELIERVDVRDLVNGSGVTFDTRPHLTRFSPTHHWVTVSVGNNLHTYNLETHGRILTMSPSMSEAVTEYPEKCNAFWYAANGRLLFSLYSNNTLCWWRSCLFQIH